MIAVYLVSGNIFAMSFTRAINLTECNCQIIVSQKDDLKLSAHHQANTKQLELTEENNKSGI